MWQMLSAKISVKITTNNMTYSIMRRHDELYLIQHILTCAQVTFITYSITWHADVEYQKH